MDVFRKHALRIAKDTLRMPDAILGVMGGPSKEEARRIVAEKARTPQEDVCTLEQMLLGGPGLDGYAFNADIYCVDCGQGIIREVMETEYREGIPYPDAGDSETIPLPVFFGESDSAQHCRHCAKYLYGPRAHYHAMAGMHGCMPNANYVLESYDAAIDSLVELHELGKKRERALRRDGTLELNLRRDGNEYCEVTECSEPDCMEDTEG